MIGEPKRNVSAYKTCVLFGGTGFIGTHFARYLFWRVAMLVMHFGRPVPEMHSHDATGYWCRDSFCVRSVAPLRSATQWVVLSALTNQ